MAGRLGFRFKEVFKGVENYLFGRIWGPVKPKAGEWTWRSLMTPLEVHQCPGAPWSYLATSFFGPSLVCWKHWPRNPGGLVCPRLLTWSTLHVHWKWLRGKEEKTNRTKTEKRNLFHQVAQPAADLRPLSFPEPMRCNLFPVMLNKIANSCGNIW